MFSSSWTAIVGEHGLKLVEISYENAAPIDGYGPGFFRVSGQLIRSPALLLPNKTITWGGLQDTADILKAAVEIDVLFVGTGAEIDHVPATFRSAIEGANVGIEVMATPSACRTYNVLLSEGRRIGAALLPV